MPQLRDLLDRRLALSFVGRTEELGLLLQTLDPDGPLVVHLHGIAGSGKSTLLDVFAQQARAAGATVVRAAFPTCRRSRRKASRWMRAATSRPHKGPTWRLMSRSASRLIQPAMSTSPAPQCPGTSSPKRIIEATERPVKR
jgi:AAA ATPase domain